MSQEQLAVLFDGASFMASERSKKLNPYGNGIGLAFCKQVCQIMDGDISAKSQLGLGTTVKFTMRVHQVLKEA